MVLAPLFSARLVTLGWPRAAADAFCIAAAAQLVTAPLIAAVSGRFSVVAVLANLVVAAVIPPITVLGTAAAALVWLWPAGAGLLIRFTGPELWWLLRVAHTAAAVPGARLRCRRDGRPVHSGQGNSHRPGAVAVEMVPTVRRRRDGVRGGVVGVGRRRRAVTPSGVSEGLHLVLGDEELLVERAVSGILRASRASAGTDGVPVNRLRAGEVSVNELAELLSPSLFADERVVVLEAAAEAGKDAVELIASAAADLPPGTILVVVHPAAGGPRRWPGGCDLGAQTHECAKIKKSNELAAFVRAEFRALKVRADDDTVAALMDSIGSDIRELAAACSQLVADTGGAVDAAAVRRYHNGKAEVTGFEIADRAVTGDIPGAAESLRWARSQGVAHVLLADALAEAVHAIARVGPLSGKPYQLAGELGMPPWRVQKAQKQARAGPGPGGHRHTTGGGAQRRRQRRGGRSRLRLGEHRSAGRRTQPALKVGKH